MHQRLLIGRFIAVAMLLLSKSVKGKRADDLKKYLHLNSGETRTLGLKRSTGELYEARITKPNP